MTERWQAEGIFVQILRRLDSIGGANGKSDERQA
jgi:hypothetical protein